MLHPHDLWSINDHQRELSFSCPQCEQTILIILDVSANPRSAAVIISVIIVVDCAHYRAWRLKKLALGFCEENLSWKVEFLIKLHLLRNDLKPKEFVIFL